MEFIKNRRFQRANARVGIETAAWCRICVETSGKIVRGSLDDELLIEYASDRLLEGQVGLWARQTPSFTSEKPELELPGGKETSGGSSLLILDRALLYENCGDAYPRLL